MTINLADIKFYAISEKEQADAITDDLCYLITKKGMMIKKTNAFFTSLTKVDEVSHLADVDEYCRLKDIPKIPFKLIEQATGFFREVYDKYKAEAIVLLLLNKDGYAIHCPKQEVSGGSLDYTIKGDKLNGRLIGTIHSHANMGAFHSAGDDDDETNFDGLHITIGNVDGSASISCSVVGGGVRTQIEPEVLIGDRPALHFNEGWMTKVKEKTFGNVNKKFRSGNQTKLPYYAGASGPIDEYAGGVYGGY